MEGKWTQKSEYVSPRNLKITVETTVPSLLLLFKETKGLGMCFIHSVWNDLYNSVAVSTWSWAI